MSGRLFALIVGINNYPTAPLAGCVDDARSFRAFLEGRVPAENLSLLQLIDDQATRQAVLDDFRYHLGQAGEGDTALFFFAGHGSREAVPPIYADSEGDGLSETLVAFDSRPYGADLADKELAVLIAEVKRRGPSVVIILDCCHSGTATRGTVRRTQARAHSRSVESYWFFSDKALAETLEVEHTWRHLPHGQHVLLAACQDSQTAREMPLGDSTRGVFSFYLLEALQEMGPVVSYRELFKRVQIRVQNRIEGQLPFAEGDLQLCVLAGACQPRPRTFHVRARRGRGWWLDAGLIHGIQLKSQFTVLPQGTDDIRDLDRGVATVSVVEQTPAQSRVELITGELPADSTALPAVLCRLALPPLMVAVQGSPARGTDLRGAIAAAPLLHQVDPEEAHMIVYCRPDGNRLVRAENEKIPVVTFTSADGSGDQRLIDALEHIARWQILCDLKNPGSPLAEGMEMTVLRWLGPPAEVDGPPQVEPLEDEGVLRLPYQPSSAPGETTPGRFTLRLRNLTERPLHFALLALDEAYGIYLVRDASGTLDSGRTLWVRRHNGIPASVPETLYCQGINQRRDTLVLIVSEERTDFELFEQPPLETSIERFVDRSGVANLLDDLLLRVGWREIDQETQAPKPLDWAIWQQIVLAVRP